MNQSMTGRRGRKEKMWLYICKAIVFVCLAFGFGGGIYILRKGRYLRKTLQEAYETLDTAAFERARGRKKELLMLQERAGWLGKMEEKLIYSGLPKRFPFLSVEIWILVQLGCSIAVYLTGSLLGSWRMGFTAAAVTLFILNFMVILMGNRNYKAVNEDLMPFINLLGNYSITAGEVTGVFGQISKYVKEPLSSALDECYYEAQTSGDSGLALLSLADKIEHPKFKEIIRNIEVCSRYSTNFNLLVNKSRKEIQDYMHARQERRAMANESLVNMFLLLAMLVITLLIVDQLIEQSIWAVLAGTIVGHAALILVAVMLVLYIIELSNTNK